jgi:hypothetical protein
MKTVHWLFVVSVALFISGIGFVIAAARTTRDAAPAVETPLTTPVASVKQIMSAIVMPSAAVVWNSVSTVISEKGVVDTEPRTDEEWAVVGSSAAALVESANLMMTGNRVVDQGDWITMSRALADTGMQALKAAQEKNKDGILSAGEVINKACDACHERYLRQ